MRRSHDDTRQLAAACGARGSLQAAARGRRIETAVAAVGAARAHHEAAARGATVPAAAHQGVVGGCSGERKEENVLSFRVPTGSLPFMRIRDGFQPLDLIKAKIAPH